MKGGDQKTCSRIRVYFVRDFSALLCVEKDATKKAARRIYTATNQFENPRISLRFSPQLDADTPMDTFLGIPKFIEKTIPNSF
ncbi:MAG TPA: hypothetical protein VJN92_04845 [Candidatus Acidoferrum sp.]|nr:hypothetical protein [Candidatus Acidoferrum sp.]